MFMHFVFYIRTREGGGGRETVVFIFCILQFFPEKKAQVSKWHACVELGSFGLSRVFFL